MDDMPNFLPKSVQTLIEELAKLPGIGPKSAQRLAMHLLYAPDNKAEGLGKAVLDLKRNVIFCEECWNVAEESPCKICGDNGREQKIICVVEDVLDVVALERTGEYKGNYHVLHGVLSPVDGIGPEQLKMDALFQRIGKGGVEEVIIATNPSLEGEVTALYIQKQLKDFGLKITRIARGLPVGGDLEYADDVTLGKALLGRAEF